MFEQNIVKAIHRNKIHPSFSDGITYMLKDSPYYGEFLLNVNFHETKEIDTAGVNVSSAGANFYWNRKFIEEEIKNPKQMTFLLIHEVYHLLFNHNKRSRNGHLNHTLSNVAEDMVINQLIMKHFTKDTVEVCGDQTKPDKGALFILKEYTGEWIFENLYAWILEKKEERDIRRAKPGYKKVVLLPTQMKTHDSEGNPLYGPYGIDDHRTLSLDGILDAMESNNGCFFDSHLLDEVPPELRDEIVGDIQRGLRARGLESSDISETLKELRKRKKDYLTEIKRGVAMMKGGKKMPSRRRPNRRNIYGLIGKVKAGVKFNCVLDTSGSMHGYFEKILSTIFQQGIEVRLLQCDAAVHSIDNIKNMNELQKIKIKGLGGTALQPALDTIKEKYNNLNNVILTDGATDDMDFTGIRGKTLILSVDRPCPISKSNGRVKQVVIEE